ncbi:MAG TPA: hypothetical protein VFR11_18310 [Micromonosporaceae bacterium]|jgi:hypothetical protein|nr:hypothetical protein [Micromonosporaceae bacterium]
MATLDELGRRHRRLRDELTKVRAELAPAMREARAAGATQEQVRLRSGYKTLQQVRTILGETKQTRR